MNDDALFNTINIIEKISFLFHPKKNTSKKKLKRLKKCIIKNNWKYSLDESSSEEDGGPKEEEDNFLLQRKVVVEKSSKKSKLFVIFVYS